jgi:hypothetical protein
MNPNIFRKVLSALINAWRFLNRLLIWYKLRCTYVDCFYRELACPVDAGGTEHKRWQEACRIEERQWQFRRPAPYVRTGFRQPFLCDCS